MTKRIYSILFFLLILSFRSYSQTDKEFWFVAPEVTSTHTDRPIYLRISAGAAAATVTIEMPADAASFNGGSPLVVVVPSNTTYSQNLTAWITQIENGEPTANITENKGLHITSTQDITVYYEVLGTNGGGVVQNSDIFVLKGANALGTTFYTPFQNLLDNADNIYCVPCITGRSSFDIVATEDNTTITITPTQNIDGHAAGVPFTITLNRGQTYSGRASGTSAASHLSGTKITSDKAIAVTIKDDSVRQNYALDLVGDQIVPVSVLGTEYIVVKGAVNTNNDPGLFGNSNFNPNFGDRAIICATQNGTTVTIGGVFKTTLAEGQTYNYQITAASEYISVSQPAYVFHMSGFGDELGGALLPPIRCTGSRTVSTFRDTDEPFYINILVKNGGQGNFTIKNSATGVTAAIPAGSFTVVPGTPVAGDWYSASILYNIATFPSLSSSVITNSTDDFHLGTINGEATGAGCRYGYFSDYAIVTGGSANASSTPICYNTATTIVVTGSAGNIQWEQSANGTTGWANVSGGSGSTTDTYTTPSLTTTTYYRAVVTKGTCVAQYSVTATAAVDPLSVGGTVSSDATVCSGSNSGTLTLAGHTGSIVKWQSSTDNFVTPVDIANVTTSQTYTDIAANTKYRAVVKSGTCSSANATAATITVDAPTVAGSVTADATVCSGANGANLTLAGHTGSIVKWQSSTDNFVTPVDIANVTTTQAYLNIAATTKYRAVVKSGTCASANSVAATITVDAPTVAGSVTADATVCSGANGANLTLAGHTGSIVKWQSSTDNFVTPVDIANVTSTQAYLNIAATTKYRAVIKSGTCASANSVAATITVDAPTVAGTVSSDATVCSGSNTGTLTLAGHTGSIVKWQSSTDNFVTPIDIANITASQTYTNIAANTKYRAVVKSGTCASANSVAATLTVDAPTVAGTVSSDATVCSGSNSGTLTLAGYTGTITGWESSTDNFVSSTPIANSTTSQTYTNITSTTKYRAIVQSGTCPSDNAIAATITVDPLTASGSVSSDATVCSGSNSGTLTLAGHTGSIVKWQSSTDNFVTPVDIANLTTSQTYNNLVSSTQYRAIIQSGTCALANSAAASITVDPLTVGGTVSSDATVCSGSNSGTLTLTGQTGSIVKWQSSTDNFVTPVDIANNTASQTYTNITANNKYRAIVQSGTCVSANSSEANIIVDAPTVAGTVSSDATVCSGSNSGTLTLAGYTGTIMGWESSTDNFTTTTPIANAAATQTYTNITASTKYRAVIKSGTCPTDNSSSASITIDPTTIGGTVSTDATVCSGSNSGTLTLAGYTGTILGWESSTDNFATTTPITNVSTSQAYTNISNSTKYRAIVQSGTCAAVNSVAATITTDAGTVAGTVSSDATVCSGSNSGTLTLTGHTGSIVKWQSSTDNFVTPVDIANSTASQTYTNVAANTQYRAVVQSGTCASANATAATINVDAPTVAGTVSSDATVCSGSNSGTLTLAGHTGNIVKWQSSTDNFVTPVDITNSTTSQTYTNVAANTKYRAVVKSGTCSSANATAATITVDAPTVAGTVSSDATVCSGSNSGTLTLAGHTGSVVKWQSSTDNFVTPVDITNATTSQTYTNISSTIKYRAIVQSGTCTSDNSIAATITVDPISVGGIVNSDQTVCAGTNSGTLTLTGNTGAVIRWEKSVDDFTTHHTLANTSSVQSFANLEKTTSFRAIVQSGTCLEARSISAKISVALLSVGGDLPVDTLVCYGTNSGTIQLSGQSGNVLNWESSTDNFATSTIISSTASSYAYANLTSSTKYRAVVKLGICPEKKSGEITINVDPHFTVNLGEDTTLCFKGNEQWIGLVDKGFTSVLWSNQSNDFNTLIDQPGTVWVEVANNAGCIAKDTILIEEDCQPIQLQFPDVITPNGDGINDYFTPYIDNHIAITEADYKMINNNIAFGEFSVYDRWGIKLFESNNCMPRWNGADQTNNISPGTFFYMVKYSDIGNEEHQQSGYITVLK